MFNLNSLHRMSQFNNVCMSIHKEKIHLEYFNLVRKEHIWNTECEFDTENPKEEEHFENNAKNLLFKNSDDMLISKLNDSACLEDIMNIIIQDGSNFKPEHIMQTVLVLRDLQKGFYIYNNYNKKLLQDFNNKMQSSEGFQILRTHIQNNMHNLNSYLLSYILLFFNKLGVDVVDDLMQDMALCIRNDLRKTFNMEVCSRLLIVIFQENSIRPYNISLELLPKIISSIGV